MKISAIVITKNEENNIRDCLESIKWCDEIIVVDSNSGDKTLKIAKEYTDKVHSVDFDNFFEKREFSLSKSACEWVLFLDADERITDELRDEILSLTCFENLSGFYINRKNFYLGKWIKHCGLYPDFHLRLFKKAQAKITGRFVHEGVEVKGKSEKLKNDMLHYSYGNIEDVIRKSNLYSTLEAKEKQGKMKISKAGVFTHALASFFVMFISRKGYKDGVYGFIVSFQYSFTTFLTYLKMLPK